MAEVVAEPAALLPEEAQQQRRRQEAHNRAPEGGQHHSRPHRQPEGAHHLPHVVGDASLEHAVCHHLVAHLAEVFDHCVALRFRVLDSPDFELFEAAPRGGLVEGGEHIGRVPSGEAVDGPPARMRRRELCHVVHVTLDDDPAVVCVRVLLHILPSELGFISILRPQSNSLPCILRSLLLREGFLRLAAPPPRDVLQTAEEAS
mmetsp:Transcript_6939/g.12005  ORF Transcript_6939/g.12005 Transcript_6939/m.12005 type:complete len:203 (+) Transcript_6939:1127-1735(+)